MQADPSFYDSLVLENLFLLALVKMLVVDLFLNADFVRKR